MKKGDVVFVLFITVRMRMVTNRVYIISIYFIWHSQILIQDYSIRLSQDFVIRLFHMAIPYNYSIQLFQKTIP